MRLTIAASNSLDPGHPGRFFLQSKNVIFDPLQNSLIRRRLQAREKKGLGKFRPVIERSLLLEDPFSIESIRVVPTATRLNKKSWSPPF
jgi:hypothetical protein